MTPATKEITILIERFLAGETSIAEEQTLYAYFARPDIDPELESYRPMFGWYATLGTNEGAQAVITTESKKPERVRILSLRPWQWISIAAMLALLLGVGFIFRSPMSALPDDYLCYEGSYMMIDGKKITDLRLVVPEIIRSQEMLDETLAAISESLDEADTAFDRAVMEGCDDTDSIAAAIYRSAAGL